MKALGAGLTGLILGVALGVIGLMWFHHHGPQKGGHHGGHHRGHHDCKKDDEVASATSRQAADEARPAYLVVLGEVHDREKFMSEYTAKLPPIYEKFGGEYLAAGRKFEVFEGKGNFKSFVISKWPSMDAARSFWASPEYDALRRARIEGNWGRFDVFALEGLAEAPKPAAPPEQK